MKRRISVVAAIVAIAAAVVGTTAVSATGTWSTAIDAPNFSTLSSGGGVGWHDHVIACPTAGNCTAAGTYRDGAGSQGYVMSQVNGVWQNAIAIPGLVALNASHYTEVDGISCSSVGNCSVVGATNNAAFTVDQVNGVWGQVQLIQGFNLIGTSLGHSSTYTISCVADGVCDAGGYFDASGFHVAFAISRRNGTWQSPVRVPGLSAIENGNSRLTAISCSSVGNCSAAGYYRTGANNLNVFVVDMVNGAWQTVALVPGLNAANTGNDAYAESMSCWSDGNCAVSGYYVTTGKQAFVADRINGVWQSPQLFPGLVALNTRNEASFYAVSCPSDGSCTAAGWYRIPSGYVDVVVDRVNGVWQTPARLPGIAALDTGQTAWLEGVGCSPDGTCAATGAYTDAVGNQGVVALRIGGVWQNATPIPGLVTANGGGEAWGHRSTCANGGTCSVIGQYKPVATPQMFVSDYVGSASPPTSTTTPSSTTSTSVVATLTEDVGARVVDAVDPVTDSAVTPNTTLPMTGSRTSDVVAIAVVLLAAGVLLTGLARWRRRSAN